MEIEYVNARIRGMKSRLFERRDFVELMSMPDLDAVIAELEKSPYEKDIERASVKFSGIQCVEEALRINLTRVYRLILELVRGERYAPCVTHFLNRWDVHNIKTILRGKHIHSSTEEIQECLMPAGELDEVTLSEMSRQEDIRAVIDLLAMWGSEYYRPLSEAYSEYIEEMDLKILEHELDRFYYRHALESLSKRGEDFKMIRRILRCEIDITNLKTLLKIMHEGQGIDDPAHLLLPGGLYLPMERLHEMLDISNIDDIIISLHRTPYRFLSDLVSEGGTTSLSKVEKELDNFITRQGIDALKGDPLSGTIPFGYIWAKLNETRNIRIIARCKAAGLAGEELMEELVYV
ncbi:MAG: ATP synthase A1 subunit C [Methanoculleaceae archaeon]